jgi:hypothetical protein
MHRGLTTKAIQVLSLGTLFLVLPLRELAHGTSLTSLANGDFWWHLRTGVEILRTHSFPHTGWFSQNSATPWIASSWLYDIVVAFGYQFMGLRLVPLLGVTLKLLIAISTFVLAGGLRGRFWTAAGLSLVAQYELQSLQPVPFAFSVLALSFELILLLQARRGNSVWPLYVLPGFFILWANVDPHFVYGIIVLVLYACQSALEEWARRYSVDWFDSNGPATPFAKIALVTGTSLPATLLTPYGWRMYRSFWVLTAGGASRFLPDFQSLRFRSLPDYVLLLLGMLAFLALGMRRSRDVFMLGILVLSVTAAFYAQHDTPLLTIAALAALGEALLEPAKVAAVQNSSASYGVLATATGLSAVILLAVFGLRVPRNQNVLIAELGESYPVAAADYIRQHRLPAPLFNTYPWGGFLAWYLPDYPLAIDGRTDLYGADINAQYAKVMNVEEHYTTFAPLDGASTILLEKNSIIAKALQSVPSFKTAYSDDLAVVLVRAQEQP